MWTTTAYSQSNGRTTALERQSTTNGGGDRAGSTGVRKTCSNGSAK